MEKTKYFYEPRMEYSNSYGIYYATYGIYLKTDREAIPLQHDVTMKYEEANQICEILNRHNLEPEQAKYVIEDCIIEKYLWWDKNEEKN